MPTRFTVKIIRRAIPTDQLLADVADVARRLNVDRLSASQYHHHGRFNPKTIILRFGSWNTAVRKLGLRPVSQFNTAPDQALADLRRVALLIGKPCLRQSDYRQHGYYTTDAIRKLFGPWHRALLAAGLRPLQYRSLTNAELFDNLKKVWHTLGRQPRVADLRPPVSRCTVGPYLTRFKTWTAALLAFDQATNPLANPKKIPEREKQKLVSTHINWRLRYRILHRDHFRCQACGRSPANDPGVRLQIDHIHPRSQGGPATASNLQTLCQQCNIGKGDLLAKPPL